MLVDEDLLCIQAYKKSQEPAVDKLKEPVYDEITSSLRRRYRLNFTKKDTTSLWFLCKQVIYFFLLPCISTSYFSLVNYSPSEIDFYGHYLFVLFGRKRPCLI